MRFSYDRVPQRVYWEITRACDLACRHCRADATRRPHPLELDTGEAFRLLGQLAAADPPPHLVLTGGDPLKRPDLFTLIAAGRDLGLRISVSPSATPLVTPGVIGQLKEAGVDAISLSLDGSTAERHDAFRGVRGTFERTLEAGRVAAAVELPVQVNTLVAQETVADLPALYRLSQSVGAARWSLFFLVQVGRGSVLNPISPEACEELMTWAAGLPAGRPVVTTTEAPHYRRVVAQRGRRAGAGPGHAAGIRDGNGIMFITHTGDVTPAGFLPLVVDNVRRRNPLEIYRDADLFRRLRDPDRFSGRCGRCEFRQECGGSRARAYAATGDPFAEDPLCRYAPN
jgi:MoaA/NifB/PqqE/SkfB family radical SAM enzyme